MRIFNEIWESFYLAFVNCFQNFDLRFHFEENLYKRNFYILSTAVSSKVYSIFVNKDYFGLNELKVSDTCKGWNKDLIFSPLFIEGN